MSLKRARVEINAAQSDFAVTTMWINRNTKNLVVSCSFLNMHKWWHFTRKMQSNFYRSRGQKFLRVVKAATEHYNIDANGIELKQIEYPNADK